MITLSQTSAYAHGLVFGSVDTVLEHVGSLAPHRDQTRYGDDTDAAYVARLLDVPLAEVHICALPHPADMAVADDRFNPAGNAGYRAASGGPLRQTRLQALADECLTVHRSAGVPNAS